MNEPSLFAVGCSAGLLLSVLLLPLLVDSWRDVKAWFSDVFGDLP